MATEYAGAAPPKQPPASSSSSPHPSTATTSSKKKKQVVSPEVSDNAWSSNMNVSKDIVDELLLVCGVIGTTVNESNEMVPVSDCLNWLQDLQRALRRDDDNFRPISLLLGSWQVVQQKLLPIVLHSRYDTAMVLTICKILVILTKPLSDHTINAGQRVIRPKDKNVSRAVIQQQIKLKNNAIEQAETLVAYKRAVCQSSLQSNNNNGVLSVFVSLLAEPLSKSGTARTDADHLTIELVLHLLRNLLAAQPLVKSRDAEQLHNELVAVFEKELVLEILLVLAGDIEHRENAQYNLLLMELLHSLLRHQDPTVVAHSGCNNRSQSMKKGSLHTSLSRERQRVQAQAGTRHSQFGGALTVRVGDKKRTLSTATLGNTKPALPKSKTTRGTEPFVGNSKSARQVALGPAASKAALTLNTFCKRFVENCYGPVMKSLKNEFRRDSVRLEDSDRVVFFKIAQFFCQWWRVSRSHLSPSTNKSSIGQLIFTMDIFTFNLVMNATDFFQQHKNYASLATSVSLLSEMMHLLNEMYNSEEQTEKIMAMGLMDRLFYNGEPLDRLPKLLSGWKPGTSSRQYLSDLAEVCHMTLKLLDTNRKFCSSDLMREEHSKHDTVAQMKTVAAEFDVDSYFARKIISNHSVFAYTHLLSQYIDNSVTVNHRVVAFFLRLCKHEIALGDDADVAANTPLAAKKVTFEPMIYTLQMLTLLNTILNDTSIRNDKVYSNLLQFSTMIIYNFSVAAKANPMLYVEALFKHPFPHRFCEMVTNMYIDEDTRMMAEREVLLQQHQQLVEEEKKLEKDQESDDDDELEFLDEPEGSDTEVPTKITRSKGAPKGNKKKSVLDDTSSDEDSDGESSEKAVSVAASKPKDKPSSSEIDDSDLSDAEEGLGRRLKEMEATAKRKKEELDRMRASVGSEDEGSDGSDMETSEVESSPSRKRPRKETSKSNRVNDSDDSDSEEDAEPN